MSLAEKPEKAGRDPSTFVPSNAGAATLADPASRTHPPDVFGPCNVTIWRSLVRSSQRPDHRQGSTTAYRRLRQGSSCCAVDHLSIVVRASPALVRWVLPPSSAVPGG